MIGRQYVFYQSMNMLEEELSLCNHNFVRTHQSYLVNARQIEQFNSKRLKMHNGADVPVSRGRREAVEQVCRELFMGKKLHAGELFVT